LDGHTITSLFPSIQLLPASAMAVHSLNDSISRGNNSRILSFLLLVETIRYCPVSELFTFLSIMKLLLILAFITSPIFLYAQQTRFSLSDSATGEPVIGARITVQGETKGAVSNIDGKAEIHGLKQGTYTITITATGYQHAERSITIPTAQEILIQLVTEEVEGDEIIVEATRDNRTISSIPTRVEVLTEEIDEAAAMDPSKIAHVITHSTGLQIQTTSATSNSANVKIQGLDGRYAQILKDGFPLYGGYSGSLSIMQIPPLDLRQIEYIKGSASTLYGGGAISGLINLLSKDPNKEETLLHMNYSSLGTTDLNAFYSRRIDNVGVTLLASESMQQAYDADGDDYSDIPKTTKINFNPKLYYYFEDGSRLYGGATFTLENRHGGDMHLVKGDERDSVHFYQEENASTRINTQLSFTTSLSQNTGLSLKNGFSFFDRTLNNTPHPDSTNYRFGGKQTTSFTELSLSFKPANQLIIAGLNFLTDDFNEHYVSNDLQRNESNTTFGGFIQDTWTPDDFFSTEIGFRGDYHTDYGFFALPRVSMLFKFTHEFSSRLGGGLGYRLPSMFNQEAELYGYRGIAGINIDSLEPERSIGLNIDFNYKTLLSDVATLSVNQLFFYSTLKSPLVLQSQIVPSGYSHSFVNADGDTKTIGFETAIKFSLYDFTLFVGYTFTQAQNELGGVTSDLTLSPKHSLKGDLLYVLPSLWRIVVDYEYKSSQLLSDGRRTRDLFMTGLVVERTVGNFVFFLNLENITDVRQTKYESLLSGPNNTPQFTEVWAPLDGFFVNCNS
jgi:outer membrane receptor for ferrienterochelin and colicins